MDHAWQKQPFRAKDEEEETGSRVADGTVDSGKSNFRLGGTKE
jgi:hypothetical protein